MVLPNDSSYEECKYYLNHDCFRYISNDVFSESKRKINKIRRISLKIIDCIEKYAKNNSVNPLKIEKHISDVKNNFLSQYDNDSFPEQLKKDKFFSLVSDLFKEYNSEINNILLTGDGNDLNNLVISSFRCCIKKLDEFLNEHICISFFTGMTKIREFEEIGIHKSDAILLEESYFLYLMLRKEIFFVTSDKDILRLNQEIRDILSLKIFPVHPSYFA